jgi:ubiquitin C-terminal hydrolase
MIRELFIDDNYNNDWICDKCKCKTDYIKSTKIWRLPDILFVIINRFINPNIKNDMPVDINPEICFDKETVLFDSVNDKKYKLASLALHSGNASGGHYTAVCDTNGAYLLYDDTNISRTDSFLEKNKNVYMLSYSLIS